MVSVRTQSYIGMTTEHFKLLWWVVPMSYIGRIQVLMVLMALISLIKLINLIKSSPTDWIEDPFLRYLVPLIPIAWMRYLRSESLLNISLFLIDNGYVWNNQSRWRIFLEVIFSKGCLLSWNLERIVSLKIVLGVIKRGSHNIHWFLLKWFIFMRILELVDYLLNLQSV